jgi:hypothetical protein
MSLEELTQAIPPCYTKWIGEQIIEHLELQNNEEKRNNMVALQEALMSREFIELVKKHMVS